MTNKPKYDILYRKLTPEEKKKIKENLKDAFVTPEEHEEIKKYALEGLKSGRLAGYIDENGEPHVYR